MNNRFTLSDLESRTAAAPAPAFVAVPQMLIGAADPAVFRQQLYQWAYERAQAAVAPRPQPRDLFASCN
jgi:hypothetical protein